MEHGGVLLSRYAQMRQIIREVAENSTTRRLGTMSMTDTPGRSSSGHKKRSQNPRYQ